MKLRLEFLRPPSAPWWRVSALAMFVAALAASAFAEASNGVAVFRESVRQLPCQPAPDSRAPTREPLGQLVPEAIVTTLTTGKMFRQGSALSDTERRAAAGFQHLGLPDSAEIEERKAWAKALWKQTAAVG